MQYKYNSNRSIHFNFIILSFLILSFQFGMQFISTEPVLSQNDDNDNYSIKYDISGEYIIVGTGKYIASGTLSIDAVQLDERISYTIRYRASIPNLNVEGTSIISEDPENKILTYEYMDYGIMNELWNIFTNDSQTDIYSVFRMQTTELELGSIKLLNYTTNRISRTNLFSTSLRQNIETYKITVGIYDGQNFEMFYDLTYMRLVGFHALLSLEIDNIHYVYSVNAVVSKASFPLPSADLDLIYVVVNYIIVGLLIFSLFLFIHKKYKTKEFIKIKGGLSSEE